MPGTGQIPFTPAAKKTLELSLREALSLGHNHVGTEHLLLGLLREREGVAVEVLRELGVDGEALRDGGARDPVWRAAHAAPAPAAARQRWEYRVIPVGALEAADVLAPLGADGWELVAVVGEAPELRAVLKRPA